MFHMHFCRIRSSSILEVLEFFGKVSLEEVNMHEQVMTLEGRKAFACSVWMLKISLT